MELIKNVTRCTICGATADREGDLLICLANPTHKADLTGIFSDLSYEPAKPLFQYLSGYQLLRLLHELQGNDFRCKRLEAAIQKEGRCRAELPPGYIPEQAKEETDAT